MTIMPYGSANIAAKQPVWSSSAAPVSSAASTPVAVRLVGSQFVRVLVTAAVCIVLLGYFREIYVGLYGLETALKSLRHFNMDWEGTLPAWFSSFVLATAAAQLAAISSLSRRENDEDWRQWGFLALIFLYLSIDEAVAIHEVLIKPLRSAFDLSGILHFSWVLPGAALVVAVGCYFLPFVLRLPRKHAIRFVTCGTIFVGGALGLELAGGYCASHYGMDSPIYLIAMLTEETLEIIGSTMFVQALLSYLHDRWNVWAVEVR